MSPQDIPVEISIPESTMAVKGAIVDSFALYAVRVVEPFVSEGRSVRSIVALRRWPPISARTDVEQPTIVQLFLLRDELRSLDDFDWANLPFDITTQGAIRLRHK